MRHRLIDAIPMFTWWQEGGRPAQRALVAASLGWMLDSFDVSLYPLVLSAVMAGLHMDQTAAGSLQSLTLLSAAAGGLVFGVIADRFGRVRALMTSVLIYSVFTAACGLATTAAALALFRICLGLGMGAEWASGAALVSETWPDRHRAKALAFMQSAWAVGFALAAVVNYLVQSVAGLPWRAVFFVGVLPALLTLWIRRGIEEPAIWRNARPRPAAGILAGLGGPRLRVTLALALMNSCTLFAYWGFNTWVPTYLSAPRESGGIGLSASVMTGLIVANQCGTWFGYVTFGYVADAIGRRRAYVGYLILAAALVWVYTSVHTAWALFALGPLTSFFATGHFSGFGVVTAELYPTAVRATAQGFTYNLGRIASAYAPRLVGSVAQTRGYPTALSMAAAAFLLASFCWIAIPETKGRAIE
jgi:MFS family permease